MRTMLDFLFRV